MFKRKLTARLSADAVKVSLVAFALAINTSLAVEKGVPLAPSAKNVPVQTLLVGSWTGETKGELVQKPIYPSQGMYQLRMNSDGTLLPVSVLKMTGPSWIVVSGDHRFAYATNESDDGAVTAVKIEPNGKIQVINKVDSLGEQPTHGTLTSDGKYFLAANYSVSGNHAGVTVLPIHQDGSLGEAIQHIPFTTGSHVIADRQAHAHAHSVNISPDGNMLFIADLGADKVHAYHYNPKNKEPFSAAPEFSLTFKPGDGPRHMAFSADGKFAYVTTEMSARVYVYSVQQNKLSEIQVVELTDSQNPKDKSGSGVLFSPNGKFLYVGNRGRINQIVVYRVDNATGKLNLTKRFASGGIEPRAFTFDKTGQYLLVANVYSNNVVELRCDPDTGALTETGVTVQIGTPTDIKFIQ